MMLGAVWIAANRDRMVFDYEKSTGQRDLIVESRSAVARAMGQLARPEVVFNGRQMLALRQVIALSIHYPYLLDETKPLSLGLSAEDVPKRRAVWDAVLDASRSATERYRTLQENRHQYLLVPKGAFASAAGPPMEAYARLNAIAHHEGVPPSTLSQMQDLLKPLESIFEDAVPVPFSKVSFRREGAMTHLRPKFHPDLLADGDLRTGIVMTDTNAPFTVTADLGPPAMIDAVSVITVLMNEHYNLPASGVYMSLDGSV